MFKVISLTVIEILVLVFTGTLVGSAVVIAFIDVNWFENVYAVEDGFVENWTLVPLLIAALYAIIRAVKLYRTKNKSFIATLALIAIFSIFIAGEEISWGQRIFNVESSEFFQKHNAQGETNLHNMVVGTTKINKLIFSQLMVVSISFYLLILPFLYRKKEKVKQFCDRIGIPIARNYQIIACLLLFISISLIPSGKNAEILEAGITGLFLLIFLFPLNKHIYDVHPAIRL